MRVIFLVLYYGFFKFLPSPTFPVLGPFFEWIRFKCAQNIFKECGEKVNIGNGANFGNGKNIVIGDYSGIGVNGTVPNNIIIGRDVMMGPNVTIFGSKHNFDRTDIPMIAQGVTNAESSVIEDDVWIGSHAIILPGVRLQKGTIVGAGAVVTKTFPPYSVIGGNPAKLLKTRT